MLGNLIEKAPFTTWCIVLAVLAILSGGISKLQWSVQIEDFWIAEGNRIVPEKEFYDSVWGGLNRAETAILYSQSHSENIISKQSLTEQLEILKVIYNLTADISESGLVGKNTVTLRDICVEVSVPTPAIGQFLTITLPYWPSVFPNILAVLNGFVANATQYLRLPCDRVATIDAFKEGGFDYAFPLPSMSFLDMYPLGQYVSNASLPCYPRANLTQSPIDCSTVNPPAYSDIVVWIYFQSMMQVIPNPYLDQYYYNRVAEFESSYKSIQSGTLVIATPMVERLSILDPATNDQMIQAYLQPEGYLNFANALIQTQLAIGVQGLVVDTATNTVKSAKYLRLLIDVNNKVLLRRKFETSGYYPGVNALNAKMGKIYLAWEQLYLDVMLGRGSYQGQGWQQKIRGEGHLLAVSAERSINDAVKEATSADTKLTIGSYIIMVVYVSTVFFYHKNIVYSRVGLSIGGIFMVLFSIVASIGLTGYINIRISAITLRVGPFLGLGLGLHDFFLLLQYYKLEDEKQVRFDNVAKGSGIKRRILGEALGPGGPSITMTTLCNILGFGIGATIPIPLIHDFALQMVLIVVINYFSNLFAFSALMVLDQHRQEAGFVDFFCCFRPLDPIVPPPIQGRPPDTEMDAYKKKDVEGEGGGGGGEGGGEGERSESVSKTTKTMASPGHIHEDEHWFDKLAKKHYIPFLLSPKGIAIFLSISVLIFSLGIGGAVHVERGLLISQAAPNSYVKKASTLNLVKFGTFGGQVVLREFYHKNFQPEILNAFAKFETTFGVMPGTAMGSAFFSILELLPYVHAFVCGLPDVNYLFLKMSPVQGIYFTDRATLGGVPTLQLNEFPPSWHKYVLLINSTNPNIVDPCDLNLLELLIGNIADTAVGPNYTIPVDRYPDYFLTFLVSVGVSHQPEFISGLTLNTQAPCQGRAVTSSLPCNYLDIFSSNTQFFMNNLLTIEDMLDAIKAQRQTIEHSGLPLSQNPSSTWEGKQLWSYPYGYTYEIYSQYLRINHYILNSVGATVGAVLGLFLLATFDLRVSLILFCCVLITLTEIYGFLYWSKLLTNGISALNIVSATGLQLEYSLFPALAYCRTSEKMSPKERVVETLGRTLLPVINAVICTFLGIVLLAVSPFKIFQDYFFIMYSEMILFGAFNGLVLLPILLYVTSPVDCNRLCPS